MASRMKGSHCSLFIIKHLFIFLEKIRSIPRFQKAYYCYIKIKRDTCNNSCNWILQLDANAMTMDIWCDCDRSELHLSKLQAPFCNGGRIK